MHTVTYCQDWTHSLEVQAGVDPDKLLLPLPVPGPLVAPADELVESLQAVLELPGRIVVADDGGCEERQPGDSLHGQHEEGVKGQGLAGLTLELSNMDREVVSHHSPDWTPAPAALQRTDCSHPCKVIK